MSQFRNGVLAALLASATALAPFAAAAETISGALAKAYHLNSTMNSARAGTRATDENVPIAKSGYRPTIIGSGAVDYSVTRNRLNVIGNSTTNLFTGSFGVQINQTLFNGFQTRNNVRAAEAQVNASDESLRNTEQNTMFNAASAYMDVIRDRQIAVLDERNLEFLSEQVRAALASHYQQDLDLQSLFKDVASAFVATAATLTEVPHLIDRAYRIAKAERRVTCVILPNDLQLMPMKQPPLAHGMTHSGVGIDLSPVTPAERELRKAADVLNSGEKVAMLVGAGALGATEELVAVADRLGAGVAKALLGKAALPDDLAFVTGSIGILGTKASWELMQGCDTLLMIGSGFPYAEFLPKPGKVRAVQIDRDAAMLGLRYPMEVNLVGDARATLRAILPMLASKNGGEWRRRIETWTAASWQNARQAAEEKAEPVNPQLVAMALSDRLPDRAIVTADSGTTTVWYARNLKFRAGMMGSVSGTLATMGSAVPYAIAAKFAFPDRPVIALAGDGAMQMNGMAELITIAKYWQDWADPRLIVMALNNRDLAYVTWEERAQAGDPKWESSQQLPDIRYADFAKLIGLDGLRVEAPGDVGPAWDKALAAARPFVLDMVTDPNVPPMPSHLTFEQARNFMGALAKGDPEAGATILQTARELVGSILPDKDGGGAPPG